MDFADKLPEYSVGPYTRKKMKTNPEIAAASLKLSIPFLKDIDEWTNDNLYAKLVELAQANEMKNGQILWPIRTALSGKPTSPCGATELCVLLGRDETIKRLKKGLEMLEA